MIKKIKIEAYQVGLLFENRKLVKVLESGLHWVFGNKKVLIYDMNAVFQAPFELNILLENEVLASMLEIVAVSYTHLRAHETRIGISYGVVWV